MPDHVGPKASTWFGGNKPGGPSPRRAERRQYARFRCQTQTHFEPAVGEIQVKNQARIADISQGGVCLLVDEAQEPGTLLHVALPSASENDSETMLACVVHAHQERDAWSLGCSFIRELTSKELQAVL